MSSLIFSPRCLAIPLLVCLCFLPVVGSSQLLERNMTPERLEEKIVRAEARFDLVQRDLKTRIPSNILANCIGIIIVQQFKAGIGIGAQGGSGVALVRNPQNGQWSPPAFVASAEGSWGWQIGAQNAHTVFCIMHREGLKILTEEGLKFGVDVRATAGPSSTGGEANFDRIDSPILVYSSQEGLFAGIAFEGGGIVPAQRKNLAHYGMNLQQVLFGGRARWTKAGASLVKKLEAYAKTEANGGRNSPFSTGQPQIR